MNLRIGSMLIKSDGVCFTLCEVKTVKAKEEGARGKSPKPENIGSEREHVLGHYGTFKKALSAMGDKTVGLSEVTTVQEIKALLLSIEKTIADLPDMLARGASSE